MRFVPVKTAEQQATTLLHRGREQLVRQRTMLVNALRAHMAEFGIVAARGLRNVSQLIAIVRDDADIRLPAVAQRASTANALRARLMDCRRGNAWQPRHARNN
jgi:transposase